MTVVTKTIEEILAPYVEWIQTRKSDSNPFRLRCHLEPALNSCEMQATWAGITLPAGVASLWASYKSGTLFRDVDRGQWGLRLLDSHEAAKRSAAERATRPTDFLESDIVLGEFLGDNDLLVVETTGAVLVALPLDSRANWPRPAENLPEFLERYVRNVGDKYWESGARR